jgi:hypothetical protein
MDMKKLLTGLMLAAFSFAAVAADNSRTGKDATASPSNSRMEMSSGTSDATDKHKHPDAAAKSTMDKARPATGKSGSAAGETGGPAATDGHTGTTNNKSNSPGK